jgi:transcriptional regulator with XRE-family HTH domain
MFHILSAHLIIQEARDRASLTQRELAERVGTSQPAIAKLEQGGTNPTIDTLARCAAAAGYDLRLELVPRPAPDAVVARYKIDVDRTLLRENLREPVDRRLRTLSEWQTDGLELERATKSARAARRRK